MNNDYVHGYHERENQRLQDQAGTLVELLHGDTAYPAGSTVLEAGCGVGAQTLTLARRSPKARFTSIDVSAESLAEAQRRVARAGLTNIEFRHGDIFALPFDPESFDHVFVCFVLIEGVRGAALAAGLTTPARFDAGIAGLRRTTETDGVFCYTFFKGTAVRGP
jgi:SAM-dependent methyltransferase